MLEATAKTEYLNHNRIIRCILFLAEKKIDKLKKMIETAEYDPRDVMLLLNTLKQGSSFTQNEFATLINHSPSVKLMSKSSYIMEIIHRQTESYLFENYGEVIRAIPFSEMSINEWVVYENKQPKYLIDFDRQSKPLIQVPGMDKFDRKTKYHGRIWKPFGYNWLYKKKHEQKALIYDH
jgi:hypothetical protein